MNALQCWIADRGWWHSKLFEVHSSRSGEVGVITKSDGIDCQYYRRQLVSVTEQIYLLVERLHSYWLKRYMVQALAERREALNGRRDADKAA